MGQTQSKTFTISNTGTGTVTFVSGWPALSVSGQPPFSFQTVSSSCNPTLAPSASCSYTVSFSPQRVGGDFGYVGVNIKESSDYFSANFSGNGTSSGSGILLTIIPSGNGTITSSPAGINCGSNCSASFNSGTSVTLTATPNSGYTFSGWSGACSGTGACVVTLNSNQTVSASFTQSLPSNYLVTVNNMNTAGGQITSNSGKINCGSLCSSTYSSGYSEALYAVPNSGYTFAGWTGDCFLSGSGPCDLTINSNKIVGANFSQNLPTNYTVTVTNINPTGGVVTSSSGKISCGALCYGSYISGSSETLTATPNAGYTFSGWSGSCGGTGSCVLAVTSNQVVSANFIKVSPTSYPLSISNSGNGIITSTPLGINCGSTCSASFNSGTSVTLTATPNSGYTFSGWSGACSGTGACLVTINSAQTVGATFTQSSGTKCSATFAAGTSVTLTETPNTGLSFLGWGGACSGTGPCVISMSSNQSVTASFGLSTFTLSLTKSGNGTISSSPSGINCGSGCSSSFNAGTVVSLKATPDGGYTFSGWSGACSGTGNCSVTMASNQNVGATFTAIPLLSVTKVGNGTITSTPSGINCGPNCSFAYAQGSSVSLAATPDSGYTFSGWSGACSGTSTCNVTMSAAQSVTATFTALPNVFSKLTVTRPTLGVIASDVAKINCGIKAVACSNSLQQGTVITLTAAPKAGYYTKGWSGCTSSTGDSCVLTIGGAPMGVSATFAPTPKFNLRVTKNKLGTVTSDPAGINCKANVTSCSSKIFSGTKVTLTATPNAGRTFVGWTGACSGKDVCSLTMDGAKGVNATFQ